MHLNERKLIERASRRDPKAFETLYILYFDKIYRYVYYKTKRKDEADDMTALVFLKAWEAIDHFHWRGYPFSTWLYRIAHNQLIDTYRTHREFISLDAAEPHDAGMDPLEAVEFRLRLNQVRSAFKYLTREQERVLTLRYFEGYSISEIALIMNKAPDAVRALQHRALRVLQPRVRSGQALPAKPGARTPVAV